MAPSNPTNPSSSPAPATPKQASALNVLQISQESWPTFLDCSMISTSPSRVKQNSSNTASEAALSRSAKQDQTSIPPLRPITVLYSHYAETEPQRTLPVRIGSRPHPPPYLQTDSTTSSTDSSSNPACPPSPTTSHLQPPEPTTS